MTGKDPRYAHASLTDPSIDDPEDIEDLALGEDYALNAEFVDMVIDASDRGDTPRLRASFRCCRLLVVLIEGRDPSPYGLGELV